MKRATGEANTPHTHKPQEAGKLYEVCDCGAVRRSDRPGEPKDDWHVCGLCRHSGFAQ